MLDYKFLLIIIISLFMYFLYRRIEKIESDIKKLKNSDNTEKKPIELKLPEEEENFQLPLPEPDTPLNQESHENFDTISFPFNSLNNNVNNLSNNQIVINQELRSVSPPKVEEVAISLPEQEQVNIDDVNFEKFKEVENIINEVDDSNTNNIDEQTLEEYSNEQSDVQIYSNDNEEELHTSLNESMVEAVNEDNENQDELNNLLKNNKLAELQQIAEEHKISVQKENNKKKTKLELAKDILNSKK